MKNIILLLTILLSIGTHTFAQYQNNTIAIGSKAPELAFANPSGETIKLSDIYEDRIVLVDFWASWCRPCRGANPRLVAMYNKYKDKKYEGAKKGFTVLSVSLDRDKNKWVDAITKDSLTWEYHMSDLGSWNSEPAKIYGVSYIPQAFLIGPDGNVIATYNSAEQAAEELEKRIVVKRKFLGIF